jgi:hypothetical protein
MKKILIILFITILSLNLVSAGLTKNYNTLDKSAKILDSKGDKLADFKLVFNTLSCGGNIDCQAVIKVNLSKDSSNLISNLRFENTKTKQSKELIYDIYIKKEFNNYETYDSKQDYSKGIYYIKIIGTKEKDEVIDWIPEVFSSMEINEWAIWGYQYTYDNYSDGSINSSLWLVDSACTNTESVNNYIELTCSNINLGGTIKTIKLPTSLNNVTFQVYQYNTISGSGCIGQNQGINTLTIFGSTIYNYVSNEAETRTEVNNWTASLKDNGDFSIFRNNILNTTITPSDTNITIYSQSIQSNCIATATMRIFKVNYTYGNNSLTATKTYPIENQTFIAGNIIFNSTMNSSLNQLKNATLYLNGLVNETKLISGYSNLTSFNKTLRPRTYNWSIKICDIDSNCVFSTTNTFNLISLIENNQTFNSNTFESSTENFLINLTYANTIFSSITASLIYNGSSYTGTKIGSDSTVTFNTNIGLLSSNLGTNIFYWRIGLTNSSGTFYYNSTFKNQSVGSVGFGLCNSTLTIPYLIIKFKDETNLSNITASIPSATFNYYVGNVSNTKTYTFLNNTENYNYSFCFAPTYLTLFLEPRIQYTSTNYQQRIYQPDTLTLTNTSTTQVLYLLGNAEGNPVTFQVTDSNTILSGVTVTAYRLVNGVNTIISYGVTDDSGSLTMWLNPYFEHTIIFEKSGYSTLNYVVTPTLNSYPVHLVAISITSTIITNDFSKGIEQNVMPSLSFLINNTLYEFNYTISSSYWDLDEFGYTLSYGNGTFIDSQVSYSSVGGSLSSFADTIDSENLRLNYYYIINSTRFNGTRYWLTQNPNKFSIWNFFNDLKTYISGNLYGIQGNDNGYFGKALICVVILVLTVGGLGYRFGFSNEATLMGLLFGVVLFLNTLDFIPNPEFLSTSPVTLGNFIVYTVLIITIGFVIKGESQ